MRTRAPSQERGAAALDERRNAHVRHRLQRRFEHRGSNVHLDPIMALAA